MERSSFTGAAALKTALNSAVIRAVLKINFVEIGLVMECFGTAMGAGTVNLYLQNFRRMRQPLHGSAFGYGPEGVELSSLKS